MNKKNILEKPALEGGKPVRKAFLVFGSPKITREDEDEVIDSIRSCWLGTGPKVGKFEEGIKNYTGARYAAALNSCTAGLHLSLIAYGIRKGDEVITTPMTFASTANVIEHVGAKPVFVDVEKDTMNIDPSLIEKKITSKTKAIIVVDMAGRPCNLKEIMKISKKNNLVTIEDAAHSFGASYHGKKIGNIADITAFSFYATKNLSTGEGGMVTSNNQKIIDAIKIYALHGMSKNAWARYSDKGYSHYLIEVPGFKYNMMDLQASLGIHQLDRFDKDQEIRRKIWNHYNIAFANISAKLPVNNENDTIHAHHLYTILLDLNKLKIDRDTIQRALHAEGIGSGIHFISLHLHPYYKNKYNLKRGMFPNAEYVSDRTISLPISAKLTEKDVEDVIFAVKKVVNYYSVNSITSKIIDLPAVV